MREFGCMGMGSQTDTAAEGEEDEPIPEYNISADGLYSLGYNPTQMDPPAYRPGYVQTEPIPKFPRQSSQHAPLDDSIARHAYLFTQPESGQTTVFGPGVQQTSEIEEVRDELVQTVDVQAEDSTDTTDSGDTDEMPLSRRGRGFSKKKQRKMYDL